MQERIVYSEDEFCRAVNISRTTCWRLRRQGKLAHLKIGDRIGFLQKHVDRFLETCEQGAPISTDRLDGGAMPMASSSGKKSLVA